MEKQKSAWSYIKQYKFNSLLIKNFFYVLVLVALPLLLVLSLNYETFDDVVNSRMMNMNESLLQKNVAIADNAMTNVLNTLDMITQLSSVTEVVQSSQTDTAYYDKVKQAITDVKTYIKTNEFIVSAHIYSDINEMLIDDNGALKADQITDKAKWYSLHKQFPMVVPYVLVDESNAVFVCQPIWSARGEQAGLFVANVDLQRIRILLDDEEAARQGVFFIMDINGQIIYCNEQDSFTWDDESSRAYKEDIAAVAAGNTQIVTAHGKRFVSVADSLYKSWKYAYVTQAPSYREEAGMVWGLLFSSAVVGVISSLLVAYLITYLTYRPMRKILSVIENPKLHWNEREATKRSNELLYITSNILADRNTDGEAAEELDERIRSLRQAQFRALQFQIDPHFLYNTLETIKWNAVEEMGLGNKTSKMLTKVAKLYRLGLENDDVIVSLKEELEFLKLYIEIVRIRFGDSIKFHWNVDESLYDCNIIKMCLQPIVENAIQHGLRPKNYSGNITISAHAEKDSLRICVENDGQYMSQSEMKKLNEKLKTGAGFEESKVGLRNVNERIKLIYGKKYGVSITLLKRDEEAASDEEQNVCVVLTFPYRNNNRSEETK